MTIRRKALCRRSARSSWIRTRGSPRSSSGKRRHLSIKGNIASFYPKSVKHVSLMFHTGAALSDPSGVLEGAGDTSRVLRVLDYDDLSAKAEALRGLLANWIALKG